MINFYQYQLIKNAEWFYYTVISHTTDGNNLEIQLLKIFRYNS